jgi:hypothetical protein
MNKKLKLFLSIAIFLGSFLVFGIGKAHATTYYIDYSSGSDSANGTTTSTPWKYSPGMPGFSGSYTHSAGDVFVFKGGVTWPITGQSSILRITYSGTNGTPDIYMGGQQCGYTPATSFQACDGIHYPCGSNASISCNGGTAWGTGYPIFTANNTVDAGFGIYINDGLFYITIDGIEIYNVGYTDGSGFGIAAGTTSNLEVKNNVLDTNAVDAFAHGIGNNTANVLFHDNLIEHSGRVTLNTSSYTDYIDNVQLYNNIFISGGYGAITFSFDNGYCSTQSGGQGYAKGDRLSVLGGSGGEVEVNNVVGGVITGTTGVTTVTNGTGYSSETTYNTSAITGSGSGAQVCANSYHQDGFMVGINAFQDSNHWMTNLAIHNNIFKGAWVATGAIYINGNSGELVVPASTSGFAVGDVIKGGTTGYTATIEEITGGDFVTSNYHVFAVGEILTDQTSLATTTVVSPTTEHQANSTSGAKIYDNVIDQEQTSNCTKYGFSPGAITIYNGRNQNMSIYNNTISGDSCVTSPFTGIDLVDVNGANIENNIFSGVDNAILVASDSTGVNIDYNIYNTATGGHLIYDSRTGQNRCNTIAACQAQGQEAHGIANTSYSPAYIDFMALSNGNEGSSNLALQSSSPAINNGTNLSSIFTTDYLGNTRQTPWDIGAYDYSADQGGTTDTTPPAAPSGLAVS